MLPGPNTLAVGRRTEASRSGGVTFIQTPGGQVPAATQGSGDSGPTSGPTSWLTSWVTSGPPPASPGPTAGFLAALQAKSRHSTTATPPAPHTPPERDILSIIIPRLTPGRGDRFRWHAGQRTHRAVAGSRQCRWSPGVRWSAPAGVALVTTQQILRLNRRARAPRSRVAPAAKRCSPKWRADTEAVASRYRSPRWPHRRG